MCKRKWVEPISLYQSINNSIINKRNVLIMKGLMNNMQSPVASKVIQINEKLSEQTNQEFEKEKEEDNRFALFLRHHTNEVKELVIENGRLSTENKEMCEYIKELEKKLAEEKSKNNAVKIKKYLGFILTLVFIFQIISFFI